MTSDKRCPLQAVSCAGVFLASTLSLLASLGCSDNRISLNEFLTQEKEMPKPEEVKSPATQPVDAQVINQKLGPYRVGPGDVLSVTLTGLDNSSVLAPITVRVDREGNIQVPAIGKIQVNGQELESVESAILAAYVPKVYQDIVVHVAVEEARLTRVLVTGAVQQPGLVQLKRTERNLLFAIVGANGVSQLASGKVSLRRIRDPNKEISLVLTDPEDLRTALALDPLEDGDVLKVEDAVPCMVYVGGLVNAPHPLQYAGSIRLTVLQAIAAAGGLRTDLTPTEITLIRRYPDGRDVHVKLDVDRLQKGRDPNISLVAGDVVWVPDTALTRVEDFFNKNFFIRAGATANLNYNVTGIEYLNRASQQSGSINGGTFQNRLDPLGFLNTYNSVQSISNSLPK